MWNNFLCRTLPFVTSGWQVPSHCSLSQAKSGENCERTIQGPCCQILQHDRYRILFCVVDQVFYTMSCMHVSHDQNQHCKSLANCCHNFLGGACVFTVLPSCSCKNNAMAGKKLCAACCMTMLIILVLNVVCFIAIMCTSSHNIIVEQYS